MKSIPARIAIEAPIYRATSQLPADRGVWTTLPELCEQAGIPLRYSGPGRKYLVYRGHRNIRTPEGDAVAVPVHDIHSPVAALRALEVLAYSFFDYGARACVTHRGYFTKPRPKPTGRARIPRP